jgi:hypothetical protein
MDGVDYSYYTTAKGILEKARTHHPDPDFALGANLISLLKEQNYGKYADEREK